MGAHVKLSDSAVKGDILSIDGENAVIQAGAMQIKVKLSRLIPAQPAAFMKTADEISIVKRPDDVPSSLMIRGMLADDALPLVERYLDRAMRAGYGEVAVIHGHGEGILRRLVHGLCDRLPYVDSYRLGDRGEGGWGVTIVKFR